MSLLPSHLVRREIKYFYVLKKSIISDSLDKLLMTHRVDLTEFKKISCENFKEMRGKGTSGLDELYGSLAGIRILND